MKFLFGFLSYLIGSLPTGYLLFFLSEKKDIRHFGSQATGGTNVLRLKGWKWAIPVVIIDISKGFLPVFLVLRLFPDKTFAGVCAFLAVLGHCFPITIKFRGGKGVATAVGAYSAFSFTAVLPMLGIFVLVIALTRYISLGSLLAAASFPAIVFLLNKGTELFFLGIVIFFLIVFTHKSNIRRLLAGNERKFGEKYQ